MTKKTKEQNEVNVTDKKTTKVKKETKKLSSKTVSAKTTKTKSTDVATKKTTSNKKNNVAKIDSKKSVSKKNAQNTSKKKKNDIKKPEIIEYYDLPYRYNETVVKVLAQTPSTLFVYWDISDSDREKYIKTYGENFFETTKPVLIIHNTTMNYSFEVDINDFANSWYLQVNDSHCDYKVELGRRPIVSSEKLETDYIYVSVSNKIESPNDRILFNEQQKMVYFRDTKTGLQSEKDITSISFVRNIGKIYNIYDLYKEIYQNENIEEIYDISNPSS